jgi:predicted nucleic acid-binding protein
MDLANWMDDASDALFLSVVTVAGIEDGIVKARREGATRKAADLAGWLEAMVHLYGSRILAIDPAVSQTAGKLSDAAGGRGHAPTPTS